LAKRGGKVAKRKKGGGDRGTNPLVVHVGEPTLGQPR